MIEWGFNQLFWSKFFESYWIVATKLIITCPNLSEMFDLDLKKVNFNQKWSNLIKFWLFRYFNQLFQYFNWIYQSLNRSFNQKLVEFNQNWMNLIKYLLILNRTSRSSTPNRHWSRIRIVIAIWIRIVDNLIWNP